MGLIRRLIFAGLAAFALSACTQPSAPRSTQEATLPIRSLATGATSTLGAAAQNTPTVVMFWRSDCALCMAELAHVRKLESAAAPGRFVTVALESPVRAAATSQRLELTPAHSFVAEGDPAAALAAVSEGGQRLPYAIVLDGQGRVCGRRLGLLGTDRIKSWIKTCSA